MRWDDITPVAVVGLIAGVVNVVLAEKIVAWMRARDAEPDWGCLPEALRFSGWVAIVIGAAIFVLAAIY